MTSPASVSSEMNKIQKNADPKKESAPDRPIANRTGRPDEVDEAEFFLVPLLATDPLPFLFDSDGNPVNADGYPLDEENGVPKAIRDLQDELRPRHSPSAD